MLSLENIAQLKDTFEIAIKLAQKSNDSPLLEKLFDARSILLDLQQENQELKEKIKAFQTIEDIKGNLIFKNNAYWKKVES